MSEFQGFAAKDLKRRPFRSSLVLLSLTSIIASTTFIFLFGNVLLDVSTFSFSGTMSSSMGMFFYTFIWAILLLVFFLGAVSVSSTISLEMVTRRRDIGLMKAMGTLLDSIFDFFMAQSVIVLLASIVLGLTFGTFFYLAGMIWLVGLMPSVQFSLNFPLVQIAFLAFSYLLIGYYSAQKPIYDTVQESPSLALNPDVGMRVRKIGYLDSFGFSFRIATKGTGRRIRGTRRTVISLLLSFTIASLLWVGGGVVETTSQAYVMRSMGTNVIAVGSPQLLEQYYEASSFYGSPLNESFNFIDSTNLINESLTSELDGLLGVLKVESRLVVYSDVQEGQTWIWNEELQQNELIGQNRDGSALLMGIDWDNTVSDWYFEGYRVNASEQVWLGGTIATNLFEDPLIQSLRVAGHSLDVRALAFDTTNGGMVALLPLNTLQTYMGVSGSNLVLVQLDSYDESLITQIESLAQSYGFSIYRQQDVLDENLQAIHAIWILLNPLVLTALVSAFLALMNYLLVSIFGRLRDYVIMKSIGAKPSFIAKVMIAEGLEMGVRAGLPALLMGTLASVYLLIPEAAVSSSLYLPFSILTMFITIILVILLSSIPVYIFFMSRTDLRISEFSS